MSDAHLSEIFASFQGEGPYAGVRQLFIRFAGCNLACGYCDTETSLLPSYKVALKPVKFFPNPVSVDGLMGQVDLLVKNPELFHSVSITGGEPLLQVDFLKSFLPRLKDKKLPVYLETNGSLPKYLDEVIGLVDIIALDFKLPASKENQVSLETAYQKEVFVKIVVTKETKAIEIDEAASVISALDPEIMTIIQPVSPHGAIKHRPTIGEIESYFFVAKRKLKRVRVIPQMHKILNIA